MQMSFLSLDYSRHGVSGTTRWDLDVSPTLIPSKLSGVCASTTCPGSFSRAASFFLWKCDFHLFVLFDSYSSVAWLGAWIESSIWLSRPPWLTEPAPVILLVQSDGAVSTVSAVVVLLATLPSPRNSEARMPSPRPLTSELQLTLSKLALSRRGLLEASP